MVAFKDSIVKYIEIVNTDCKYVFWFRVNKSLLGTTEDAIFGVVYIPQREVDIQQMIAS